MIYIHRTVYQCILKKQQPVSQKNVVEACNVANFSKEYSTVCSLLQLYSSILNTGWVAERIHFGRAEFEGTKWKRRGGERERKKEKGKGLPSHTGRLSLNTVIFGNKHLKTDLSHCFPQVLHYHNGFSLQRGIKAWRHFPNSTQMQLVMHIIPAQHIRCHY